jgi:short-subunit dehydrogenase
MSRVLVVGGANGIGLAMATALAERRECDRVYIVDRVAVAAEHANAKFHFTQFDLMSDDFALFEGFEDVDTLIITAGFGRLAHFADVSEEHLVASMTVNATAVMRIIHHFYGRIMDEKPFRTAVMGSIAGFLSSPLFAVYGASKAALKIFIESLNVELEKSGTQNRILHVAPGAIKGTSFYNGTTDLSQTRELAEEILLRMERGDDLYIPRYDEVYGEVLERYHQDFRAEGRHSYEYKMNSKRE